MRLRLTLLVLAGAVLIIAEADPASGRRVRPRPPARRPARAVNPNARLIVQEEPPPPPQAKKKPKTTKPAAPVPRWRRYAGYNRRSTTLYLRERPSGRPTIQLRVGLEMTVLQTRGKWTQVETSGLIRVNGWVPTVTLGLRVQSNTSLYGRPGGKALGEVAAGQLVHVIKNTGAWAQVRLMGYLPFDCYIKRKALGIAATSYRSLGGRYPGGSPMVVSAGPMHQSADGPVAGRAADEGRVYRVRVVGRWSQVAMYDYSRVQVRVWVPTSRLRWGGYPWYGSGYNRYNCKVGTSGSQVALAEFKVYAARDDAWPTIRVMPNARFNVGQDRDGWVRITSHSCIQFNAYAEDRPGDWTPSYLIGRRR